MKIIVETTQAEISEMGCESAEELAERLRSQLDDGVCDDAGSVGGDWLSDYSISVRLAEI